MKSANILFEKAGWVALLTINRPEKCNVVNKATRMEIFEVQKGIAEHESIGVLVITGAMDQAFAAGSEIALACELPIASDQARFGQPETNRRIIPGACPSRDSRALWARVTPASSSSPAIS